MDDFSVGGESLLEAFRHLSRLNRIFGAQNPILYGIKYLWKHAGKPKDFTILDIGSGSGDINLSVLKWADKRGVKLKIVLTDVTEEARTEAERLFRTDSRVDFVRQDLFRPTELRADIVTASQFVHHFPSGQLPSIVNRMLSLSRIGVVINDIHRHWIPWTAVWIATRIVSRNPYIRHDGPLSVARGFRGEDFRRLSRQLGNTDMTYRWRPLFRYAVIVPKRREAEFDENGI
ncbi:methyltransferase domain-containing protein [Cohnella terricola]